MAKVIKDNSVVVGHGVKLGNNVRLGAHAVVANDCIIGDHLVDRRSHNTKNRNDVTH